MPSPASQRPHTRICYLGDDTLMQAAVYLAGIMEHYGLAYDHVASSESPDEEFCRRQYALYVISDYSAARFCAGQMEHLVDCVREGAGLAMFGGWESFHGRLGEYHRTALAEALPVEMGEADDRRNCAQPCLVRKDAEHPIVDGLPWDRPPGIGGYNAFRPKAGTQVLLSTVQFSVRCEGSEYRFRQQHEAPLLVVGSFGRGRTAALATDVAPHWVGGMVDWGDERMTQDVADGFIEVGNHYARFFRNLLVWTGAIEGKEGR
jgi:uncharacterized membrane protein